MVDGAPGLLANLPLACLTLNQDGFICKANASAENLFRRSRRNLKGQSLGSLFPGAQALQDLFDTAITHASGASSPEIKIDSPYLGRLNVSAHLSPMGDQEWILILINALDESAVVRAANSKARSGSLSAMAGMLAHEIKNPLAAIQGAAQLMADHSPDMAHLIVGEIHRISKLLNTLELFSSPQDVDIGVVNIHEVLDEVVSTAKLSFGNEVRFIEDYDPSLPPVCANPHVLHRVLLNLIKNACEACVEVRGVVRLKTRICAHERRQIKGAQALSSAPISLSVIDNGRGIEPSMRARLFDAFVSTKNQGQGLGLAYVAEAVASMGGQIDFSSLEGKTEFQLRLPQA